MSDYGACVIAFGREAEREVRDCVSALKHAGVEHCQVISNSVVMPLDYSDLQRSRFAKVMLPSLAMFKRVLYVDADTRTYSRDILTGFDLLRDGWEMVITPSPQQDGETLWHVSEAERETTFDEWGTAQVLQLQCGVMWFTLTDRVREFFNLWREEWLRWQGQDQAAFLRALNRFPLKVWLLGRPFDGGAVVGHRWGVLRES